MIAKNPMQLKAIIKKKAAECHISAQLVMQNYMLERLLERISLSPYKKHLILKGGFLISTLVGLDSRATMDLDTTIKGIELSHERILAVFQEICKVPINDSVDFSIKGIHDIREADEYPGIRVSINASYPPLSVPLAIDITTGDAITPHEIEYTLSLLFEDRSISVLAYNLETVLAEKIETILTRNIANTRPRDFYDVTILWKLHGTGCDKGVLQEAFSKTAARRGSAYVLAECDRIVGDIVASERLQTFWSRYQTEFEYAREISFAETCKAVKDILAVISQSETIA